MRHLQTLFSILALATMLISCEKKTPETITSLVAQPPAPGRLLVEAGNDTLIYFPTDYDFALDGSLSVFPPIVGSHFNGKVTGSIYFKIPVRVTITG